MGTTTVEEQVLSWPPARKVALAERLLASVDAFTSPEIEKAWQKEIGRRVREINAANTIPAEEVIAEVRRKLGETRRLSQARRKRTN